MSEHAAGLDGSGRHGRRRVRHAVSATARALVVAVVVVVAVAVVAVVVVVAVAVVAVVVVAITVVAVAVITVAVVPSTALDRKRLRPRMSDTGLSSESSRA